MSIRLRRRSWARIGAVGASLTLLAAATPAQAAPAAPPPWEAVRLQKILLPATVTNAAAPAYTNDGKHLLFFANVVADGKLNPDPNRGKLHLWIVGTDGRNAHCLSCGTDEPLVGEAEQPGLITPFPDGKRALYGPYPDPRVLECLPSLLNCLTSKTYPIDLTGARAPGGVVPPGGAVTNPVADRGGTASPKLSPDGRYLAFSAARSDSIQAMTLAKLTRSGDKYVTSDPRILNPPGPTSLTDPNAAAWSDSSALFEFKAFVDGGRAITYVQVGGVASGNPDLWKLDLRTGKRTRLAAAPEWEEDAAISPDGKSLYVGIDSQRRHYVDWAGLLPFRGFFDAAWIAGLAAATVSSAELRSCAPFASALLPADGDRGGRLVGQILDPYDGGDVRDSGQIHGAPIWSPDSTAIALTTQSFTTLAGAPYLLVAHLGRSPSRPLPVVSSAPGAWAPKPEQYHGAIGAKTTITLRGKSAGTVTVNYANLFASPPPTELKATYTGYSDDGTSFVDGTQTVRSTGAALTLTNDLALRGAHTGSLRGQVTFGLGGRPFTISGTQTATYDGTTVTGPRTPDQLCQGIRDALPKRTPLGVRAERSGGRLIVRVTAAYDGAGPDERGVDRRPVRGATVKAGRDTAVTDRNGVAILDAKGRPGEVTVDAGSSFLPSRVSVS